MKLVNQSRESSFNSRLDESMIPAINIIFLLLIFFMIAGQIEAYTVSLPASSSTIDHVDQEIVIHIMSEDEVLVNGQRIEGQLIDALIELDVTERSTVSCFVDKDLPASAINSVLRSVRSLGISDMFFATELKS